jgi:hypothetical protein
VQITYPKKKPVKPASHYVLTFSLLAVMALAINTLYSMALPDPLGEKIQNHVAKFHPTVSRGSN